MDQVNPKFIYIITTVPLKFRSDMDSYFQGAAAQRVAPGPDAGRFRAHLLHRDNRDVRPAPASVEDPVLRDDDDNHQCSYRENIV